MASCQIQADQFGYYSCHYMDQKQTEIGIIDYQDLVKSSNVTLFKMSKELPLNNLIQEFYSQSNICLHWLPMLCHSKANYDILKIEFQINVILPIVLSLIFLHELFLAEIPTFLLILYLYLNYIHEWLNVYPSYYDKYNI